MPILAEMIAAQNAGRKTMGLMDSLKLAGRVFNEGLLNPNQFNAPAANRFKDSAFGLLGLVPGVGDAASAAESADLFNRGESIAGSASALGALPLVPSIGGMLVGKGAKMVDALKPKQAEVLDAASKMEKVGLEPGWFRGGPAPKGNQRTGPWYTQNQEEAAGYANRFGEGGDIREYAIPSGKFMHGDSPYNAKLAHDVAKILDDPYYGKAGANVAKDLRTFNDDEAISGIQLWQSLKANFGQDDAAEIIDKLNTFNGLKGITAGPEAYIFNSAPVRDAKRARFDPSSPAHDLYGRATLPAILTTGGLGAAGLLGTQRNNRRDGEERKR